MSRFARCASSPAVGAVTLTPHKSSCLSALPAGRQAPAEEPATPADGETPVREGIWGMVV